MTSVGLNILVWCKLLSWVDLVDHDDHRCHCYIVTNIVITAFHLSEESLAVHIASCYHSLCILPMPMVNINCWLGNVDHDSASYLVTTTRYYNLLNPLVSQIEVNVHKLLNWNTGSVILQMTKEQPFLFLTVMTDIVDIVHHLRPTAFWRLVMLSSSGGRRTGGSLLFNFWTPKVHTWWPVSIKHDHHQAIFIQRLNKYMDRDASAAVNYTRVITK